MTSRLKFPIRGALPSYWFQEARGQCSELHNAGSNPLPSTCDIAIIGGGFAGVSTAYHLLKSPHAPSKVVLFEGRVEPSQGATGRNGGNLRPDRLMAPSRLCRKYGAVKAAEVMRYEIENLNTIRELIQQEGIECDFRETTSMLVFSSMDQVQSARENFGLLESHCLLEHKDAMVELYAGQDAPQRTGMRGAKGYVSMPAAHLSPYKLVKGLLKRCMELGLILQTGKTVTSIHGGTEDHDVVTTAAGDSTLARVVIHATNAYASALLPEYSTSIVPCKGLACRIAPPDGAKLPKLATSSMVIMEQDLATGAKGSNYMIQLDDTSLIIGGGHHKYGALGTWYDNSDDGTPIPEVAYRMVLRTKIRAFLLCTRLQRNG